MGLSDPRADSLDIISFQPLKLIGINQMILIATWADSLDIISLKPVKKTIGINPIVLISPWADSFDISL